jgi:hypothetical protein
LFGAPLSGYLVGAMAGAMNIGTNLTTFQLMSIKQITIKGSTDEPFRIISIKIDFAELSCNNVSHHLCKEKVSGSNPLASNFLS